jgi:4-hydroxy-3-methylbut-2-enyl diphosphate reductase
MSQLVICAPLRLEHRAVRRGTPPGGASLVRIGMGPVKARREFAELSGDGSVAVLGVAGGLAPHLRVPDLVVASRVVTTDGFAIDCPLGADLATRLSEAGLTTHLGTIVSVPKIVEGAERTALAEKYDALACDMESGYVAERLAPGRSFVVVRALSDSVTQPLLRPSILKNGAAALANVRKAAVVVCNWAADTAA